MRALCIILALLLCPLGLYFAGNGAVGFFTLREMQTWPTAAGEVVESSVRARSLNDAGRKAYYPYVRYSFRVQGRLYEGKSALTGPQLTAHRKRAERIVRRFPAGAAVTVHYLAENPARALLDVRFPPKMWRHLALGVLVTLCGCYFLGLAVRRPGYAPVIQVDRPEIRAAIHRPDWREKG